MTIIKCALGALALAGAMAATPAQANDAFIGDIRIFASKHCPEGWLKTNGGLYSADPSHEHSPWVLATVLQRRYGGDGSRYFRVPNNPQPETVDHRPLVECIAWQGIYPFPPHQ